DRDAQLDVRGAAPVAVAPRAVLALVRLELLLEAVLEERREVLVDDEPDAAAVAAVAARGAAAGHVLLAPERHRAVAAVAGLHVDGDFVDEHPRSFRAFLERSERPATRRFAPNRRTRRARS